MQIITVYSNDHDSIIEDLLKKVHEYYPVGMPDLSNSYSGRLAFNEIIRQQYDGQRPKEETESWSKTLDELKKLPQDRLYDLSMYQFPNYAVKLTLEKSKDQEVYTERTLHLAISLLTHHFTTFYSYSIEIESLRRKFSRKDSLQLGHIVFYGKETANSEQKDLLTKANNIVTTNFPDHYFVAHDLLMKREIEGVMPYDEELEYYQLRMKAHSFYELLFDNGILRKNPDAKIES